VKLAQVVGRVFCARQDPSIEGKRLLLIQPLRWEDGSAAGDPIVAADVCGAGASEKVFWVAARDAAVAFKDAPPVDAAIVGIVDGHQAKSYRGAKS
jgi:ethanolamine utilization protein EutN